MGLAFRLAVGVGFLGVLSLFGCASTAPPNEDLAASRAIAVPQARTSPSGAAAEIDPDCPYLTVEVTTWVTGRDPDERRASYEFQKPYMDNFSAQLERVGFKVWEKRSARLKREGFKEQGAFIASLSEETNEGPTRRDAREKAEWDKLWAKLTTHDQARVNQIIGDDEKSNWIASSDVLDLRGSEHIGLPKGDRILVWKWTMKKRPTVLDGAIRVDSFTIPNDDTDDMAGIIGRRHPRLLSRKLRRE